MSMEEITSNEGHGRGNNKPKRRQSSFFGVVHVDKSSSSKSARGG